MTNLKKIYKLILAALFVVLPFVGSEADAADINIPISVEWYYGDEPFIDSPHRANVVIEPISNAPAPTVSSFDYVGDYKILMQVPKLTGPGRYEYRIMQTNEDFDEENFWVTYDKTVYRLVFILQEDNNPAVFVYKETNDGFEKMAELVFRNNDPHRHKDSTTPTEPSDPSNPTDSTKPTDDERVPIYPTEPEDSSKPNKGNDENKDPDGEDHTNNPDNTGNQDDTNQDDDGESKDPTKAGDEDKSNPDGEGQTGQPTDDSDENTDPSKSGGADDDSSNPSKEKETSPKLQGKDKKSHNNVQTGIESLGLVLIILVLAILAYLAIKKSNKN